MSLFELDYTQACSSHHQNVIRICFRLWFFSICQAQPKYQQIPRWHCCLVYLQRGKTPFRTTLQFSRMMDWNILLHYYHCIGSYLSNLYLNILVKQRFLRCEYAQCAKLIHALRKLSWIFYFGLGQVALFFQTMPRLVDKFMPVWVAWYCRQLSTKFAFVT